MDTVQVLMAAYQGARYLPQQIDSILAQEGVGVLLLARDDGSADGTVKILKAYEKRHPNITVYTGGRLGAAGSFYDLLKHADPSADYYAFADQDDVWHKRKLLRAVSKIKKQPGSLPVLYAGGVVYASKNLNRLKKYPYPVRRGPSFGNALMENICMGCTEVFNSSLLELARGHVPRGGIMHDWWMYLTAAYFGKVLYDPHAYILYRQHGKNAIGMQDQWGRRWLHRIQNMHQMKHKLSGQAKVFQSAYAGQLEMDESLQLLCTYRDSLKKRLRITADPRLYRQNVLDDIVCRLLFLFGFL